ncbi:protein COFACTOR ASSEMBLY OF COMPLEX C SUBUNIT B CCB4, chloroplastic-like [Elaeis guineensis]|uniref:protein COFACTOR ASSEMBLY OF COMPLEX C SUBUNIT B CCB4, chloroplastic-like n=1 Tax=Elaeis guineensis var. tenera TaxID=51953 RepID=UPI003C6D2B4D
MHGGYCLLQIGVAAESLTEVGQAVAVDVHKLIQTAVYRSVIESRKQSYLANLSLYPARSELPFLPANTQAVILQPLGNSGIAIIGGDTIRGFTNLDQERYSSIQRVRFIDQKDSSLKKIRLKIKLK